MTQSPASLEAGGNSRSPKPGERRPRSGLLRRRGAGASQSPQTHEGVAPGHSAPQFLHPDNWASRPTPGPPPARTSTLCATLRDACGLNEQGSRTRGAPRGPRATRASPSPPLGIAAQAAAAAAAAPRTDTGTGNASGTTSSARPRFPQRCSAAAAAVARAGDLREAGARRLSRASPESRLACTLPRQECLRSTRPGETREPAGLPAGCESKRQQQL